MPSSAPVSNLFASRFAPDCTPANLRALKQLETAIVAHTDWLKKLHSGMAFTTRPSMLDTHPDAHLHCEIGHWLACHHESSLRTDPALAELQEEHRLLHQGAAAMLARFRLSGKPDIHAFAALIGHTRRMHELLQQLRTSAEHGHPADLLTADNSAQQMLITRLQQAQAAQRPDAPPAAVCLLEIDQFDAREARPGSAALGSIMCEILFNIKNHLRPEDWLMRKRDSAVLLYLDQMRDTQTRGVLDRIRESLADFSLRDVTAGVLVFTVSAGGAELNHKGDPSLAIHRAEQALYAAKGMGGNRVMLATDCQDIPLLSV